MKILWSALLHRATIITTNYLSHWCLSNATYVFKMWLTTGVYEYLLQLFQTQSQLSISLGLRMYVVNITVKHRRLLFIFMRV